jgi:hypothetical protein
VPLVDPTFSRTLARDGFEQDPLSNRACEFPAHGLPVVSRVAALCCLRIADRATQAVEAVALNEEIRPPVVGTASM